MQSAEELHEALISLQCENLRLRTETEHATLLLRSLESLLLANREEEPFRAVFRLLREVFSYEQVMVLVEEGRERLACIVAEPAALIGRCWPVGPFLEKVLSGKVTATFSNHNLPQWCDAPADAPPLRRSTLYIPINVPERRGMLVLLRADGDPGFDRSQVTLARKFSLLASHALAARSARQRIDSSETRALAAEEASRLKNMLIANMSHEFRTPLNAIIGFSEVMLSPQMPSVGPERRREYLEAVHASGQHLLSLVNNILLFAKIEAGRHVVETQPLAVAEQVQAVLQVLQVEADKRGVALLADPCPAWAQAAADEQSLRQILFNLIGNALKFSPRGKSVRIGFACDPEGGGHRLSVRDEGCGIPPATLEQLGNPFVQAEDAFSRRHQGTGLGLAISFRLAAAMGGAISIESTVGVGTVVTLRLRGGTATSCAA